MRTTNDTCMRVSGYRWGKKGTRIIGIIKVLLEDPRPTRSRHSFPLTFFKTYFDATCG
jgi:hypothetical protein